MLIMLIYSYAFLPSLLLVYWSLLNHPYIITHDVYTSFDKYTFVNLNFTNLNFKSDKQI